MRIAMIGSGYVGLVSGACFAQFGHDVVCVDKDAEKIARLRAGEMPIYEPGLDKLVADNVRADRLTFGTNLGEAVGNADAVFIAVGTPTRRGDGHADLSFVEAANLADHPARRFLIDPQAQFDLMRALRGTARRIVGCFHSHPGGSPEPSATDLGEAYESDFLYLIAAGSPDAGFTLAAHVFDGGKGFTPIALP